jgi:thiol-disulfide isomerase/thioredoxin
MNERCPKSQVLKIAAIFVCIAVCIGCGHNDALPVTSVQTPSAKVTVVDRAGLDAELAKLRGKVVLVDFWATWCRPCVDQLPHTLDLRQHLAGRGLAVVTVSCDDPAEIARVTEVLSSKNAEGASNFISQFGGSPQTMEAFEISTGAVPFYKVYDRTGKLRQTFGIDPASKKQFTPADIEAAVEQLLAERD